jgi:hypothetical protein
MQLPASFTTVTPFSKVSAILLFISLPFIGFYLGVTYYKSISPNIQKQNSLNTEQFESHPSIPVDSPSPILKYSKTVTDEDIIHYKNDVLGLEFSYPKEWGEIRSYPGDVITNLDTVNKEFKDGDNGNDNKYMVSLSFNQNHDVAIKLIDNQYPGELFSNGNAFDFGPMDNWTEIKNSQDVCLYKVNYSKGIFRAQSLYSNCSNGINEVLIKSGQTDTTYENYSLRRYGYKRLNNGYFDNFWLIAKPAFTQSHDTSRNLTVDEVKSETDLVKDKRESESMVALMASVKSFVPPKPTVPVFINIAGEDPNITLIRKYYYFLASHQFNEAYQLSENVTLTNIRDWYQNVIKAEPKDFKTIGVEQYEFLVDYQDDNTFPMKYLINMGVTNGKLKTLKSEKYVTDIITFGKMSAVVKERQGSNYVLLTKNGKENIIDKAIYDYNEDFTNAEHVSRFSNLQFSSTGKYLTYSASGWEWFNVKMIDTQTLKPVKMELPSASTIEFNSNDSKVFVCAKSEMSGDSYSNIYHLPELTTERDFLQETKTDLSKGYNLDCSFDKNNQTATIEIKSWDESIAGETIKVDLR